VSTEVGIKMVAEGIEKILDGYKGSTQLLIEISAGAGNVIGDTFEEIGAILKKCKGADVGICFDTAHAFASGYDLRTKDAVKKTFDDFDRIVGLDKLVMSHCNDSKVEIGTHKDRHEHIGKGHIGLPGFEALMKEKRLKDIFWIVETPSPGDALDIAALKKIRG
jgi:deoxyribonuclease-4